jgi:hypothetical protein
MPATPCSRSTDLSPVKGPKRQRMGLSFLHSKGLFAQLGEADNPCFVLVKLPRSVDILHAMSYTYVTY